MLFYEKFGLVCRFRQTLHRRLSWGPRKSLIDFSHDSKRLLDHYGAQKAHIAGLAMGGMIAQDFYSLYPERMATLVLCDMG